MLVAGNLTVYLPILALSTLTAMSSDSYTNSCSPAALMRKETQVTGRSLSPLTSAVRTGHGAQAGKERLHHAHSKIGRRLVMWRSSCRTGITSETGASLSWLLCPRPKTARNRKHVGFSPRSGKLFSIFVSVLSPRLGPGNRPSSGSAIVAPAQPLHFCSIRVSQSGTYKASSIPCWIVLRCTPVLSTCIIGLFQYSAGRSGRVLLSSRGRASCPVSATRRGS